ncbi:hypothetical protein B0H12DRAFT_294139 [Mycena haematopus]|nr:hypothetical protein B0H12DRAFT_294139 [Mycena haematopus]
MSTTVLPQSTTMTQERQRVVYQEWVRDPRGKLLEKPPPRGSRPENNIIWGHTLEDFYWISRIPGVNVLTIWSRSMIEEYGENYLNVNGQRERGPEPRRLRPWPVLTLPEHVASSATLGYIDEGCGERHEHPPRRIEVEIKNPTRDKAKAKLRCPTLFSLECCPVLYCPPETLAKADVVPVPSKFVADGIPPPDRIADATVASAGVADSTPSTTPIEVSSASALPAPGPASPFEREEPLAAAKSADSEHTAPLQVDATDSAPPSGDAFPPAAADSEHTAPHQVDTTDSAPPPPGDAVSPAAADSEHTEPLQVDTVNSTPDDAVSLAHIDAGSTTPISATLVPSPSEDSMKSSLNTACWDCAPEALVAAHPTDAAPAVVVATDSETDIARLIEIPAPLAEVHVPVADTMDGVPSAIQDDVGDATEHGAVPEAPIPAVQAPGAEAKEAGPPEVEEGSWERTKSSDGAETTAARDGPTDTASAPAALSGTADAMAVDAPKVQDGATCGEEVQAVTRAVDEVACLAATTESKAATEPDAAPAPTTSESAESTSPSDKPSLPAQASPPEAKKAPPPPVFHDLPKLEEFIPDEYFPDILYINDPDDKTAISHYYYGVSSNKNQSLESVPRKYKRVWPRFARDTEPATAFNTDPDCASIKVPAPPTESSSAQSSSPSPPAVPTPETNLRIARLNLSSAPVLGVGNHSAVFRAALRLPAPLSAAGSPTGEVAVAAKTGFSGSEARGLLRNEGKIYGAFPKHLQEDWCGLNLVAPIAHPVPVRAVVPKFYGYYVPVMEDVETARQKYARRYKEEMKATWREMRRVMEEAAAQAEKEKGTEGGVKDVDGAKGDEAKCKDVEEGMDKALDEAALQQFMRSSSYQAWHRLSPILLLEECGEPIIPRNFTLDERSECYSLALRLHFAEFTQNSFYVRNILRQPGPLTVAPSARSDKTPSFRIIDHGRGEHWPFVLDAAAKKIELEQRKREALRIMMGESMHVPTEEEMKRRVKNEEQDKATLKEAEKKWWDSRDYEVRKAHSELEIPDFDY